MNAEKHEKVMQALRDKYEPRIRKILNSYRAAFQKAGWEAGEIDEISDEEFRWMVVFQPPGAELEDGLAFDITFYIVEQQFHEKGEGYGVTFRIDIVEEGGRILGGMAPYNYTEQCWVDSRDADEVEARFRLFEQADPQAAVSVVEARDE